MFFTNTVGREILKSPYLFMLALLANNYNIMQHTSLANSLTRNINHEADRQALYYITLQIIYIIFYYYIILML